MSDRECILVIKAVAGWREIDWGLRAALKGGMLSEAGGRTATEGNSILIEDAGLFGG